MNAWEKADEARISTALVYGATVTQHGFDQAEQMVSQVNAEVALKSLMDAELALTKARDLLRRSRGYLMVHTPIDDEGAVALVHGINDLLGD